MSTSKRDLAIEKLEAERAVSGARFVDIGLRVLDHRGEEIIRTGGNWDSVEARYIGEAEEFVEVELTPAQAEAGGQLVDWLRRHVEYLSHRADGLDPEVALELAWEDAERVDPYFTLMWYGARRSGKSFLAVLLACLYALIVPGSRVVVVAPKQEQGQELLDFAENVCLARNWRHWMPSEHTLHLLNGSRIEFLTGRVSNAKIGPANLVIVNEAQEQDAKIYKDLQGSTIDGAGLVVLTCNPPRTARGQWVQWLHDAAASGKNRYVALSWLDPSLNTEINQIARAALAEGLTELEIRREILGDMSAPIGDVIMTAMGSANVLDYIPGGWIDVTRAATARWYEHEAPLIIGCDFDKTAGCSWVAARFYLPRDVSELDRAVLVIEHGRDQLYRLEQETIETLTTARDRHGYLLIDDPADVLIVADASARTQDTTRKRENPSSWAQLMAAGFANIVPPDPQELRNPKRDVRFAVTNDTLRNRPGLGIRVYFRAGDADRVIEAARTLPRAAGRDGKARDPAAHITDSWSYIVWRRWGRVPTAEASIAASAFATVPRRSTEATLSRMQVGP